MGMVPETIQLEIMAPTQIITKIDGRDAEIFSLIPSIISSQLRPQIYATTAATAAAAIMHTCVGNLNFP